MVRPQPIYTRTGDDGTTGLGHGRAAAEIRSAGRSLRHRRRDQRLRRPRPPAHGRAIPRSTPCWRASRTTSSTSAPTSRTPDTRRSRCPTSRCASSTPRSTGSSARSTRSTPSSQPLRSFVLPGGSPAAAALHLARTVSRRAERLMVALAASRGEIVAPPALQVPQPAVGLPVRRRPATSTTAAGRRAVGAGQEPELSCAMFMPLHDGSSAEAHRRSQHVTRPDRVFGALVC